MIFTETQTHTLAQILRDAAVAEVMPRFRQFARQATRPKTSHLDLVTDADEAAERLIAQRLAHAFPGAVIVGEEAASAEPALLDHLATADLAILVDPIDGTKNFASGLPLFGVMAAVVVRGATVAGVIYDPVAESWALGLRGVGAWIEDADGERSEFAPAAPRPLPEMLGLVSWVFMDEPFKSTVTGNFTRVAGAADYRTAAHAYRLVAAGHYDFAMFGKVMPWDHAAGCLILEELGGYCALFDGTPYRPTLHTGGLLCAPDRDRWSRIHEALLGP
jgi:fructose-1,6-bisphosphatase/inositol monophosphatase family enzyme